LTRNEKHGRCWLLVCLRAEEVFVPVAEVSRSDVECDDLGFVAVMTEKQKKEKQNDKRWRWSQQKGGGRSQQSTAAAAEASNLFVPVARILQKKTFVSRRFLVT
jgi:hypothetical protein